MLKSVLLCFLYDLLQRAVELLCRGMAMTVTVVIHYLFWIGTIELF